MRFFSFVFTFLFITVALLAQKVDDATPVTALPDNNSVGQDWILDFSDEFNDNTVDQSKWNIDDSNQSRAARPKLGIDYWMWKSSNVWEADGNLVLQVTKASANTMHCGSIHSHNKYETRYGYFEARIKIAEAAKGTHTAFWLQGPNMSNVDGTANDGAEIDIFESAWLQDYTKSVVHIDGYGNDHQANTKKYNTPGLHSGYHTFGLHWTKDFMKIYYDGELKVTYSEDKWVVRADEFLWLSDGASFGFEGDYFLNEEIGVLTAAYVDYIRVWKPMGAASSVIVNGDFEEDPEADGWFKNRSDIDLYKSFKPLINAAYCKMPDADNERGILQTVNVEPGQPYEFTMRGRIQNSDALLVDENNHPTKGPATLKGELKVSGDLLLDIETQANRDETVTKQVMIPDGVDKVLVKVTKNWNIAYIDYVYLSRIRTLGMPGQAIPLASLTCYPNPCQSAAQLTIKANEMIQRYQVLSLSGQVIVNKNNCLDKQCELSTKGWAQGLYILSVQLNSGATVAERIIIN